MGNGRNGERLSVDLHGFIRGIRVERDYAPMDKYPNALRTMMEIPDALLRELGLFGDGDDDPAAHVDTSYIVAAHLRREAPPVRSAVLHVLSGWLSSDEALDGDLETIERASNLRWRVGGLGELREALSIIRDELTED